MAGHGPAPTDPDYRARGSRSDKGHEVQKLAFTPVRAPRLESIDRPGGDPWPAMTLRWYQNWQTQPQAARFTATDWDFLIETAFLHAAMVEGDYKLAPEVRLRVAKFGATPEDRARLRLQFADGDEPPSDGAQKPPAGAKARAERGHLRVVGG